MHSRTEFSNGLQTGAGGAGGKLIMNTYQWLIILGFPPSLAAAQLMPELFTTDSANATTWEQSPRCAASNARAQE